MTSYSELTGTASYSDLTNLILQVPVLAEKVEEWASDDNCLDLVTEGWKKRLETNETYLALKANCIKMFGDEKPTPNGQFRMRYLKSAPCQMVVAATCSVSVPYKNDYGGGYKQPFAVMTEFSAPLDMMAVAMTGDVDTSKLTLSGMQKLSFKSCCLVCRYCQTARQQMKRNGVTVEHDSSHPCIMDMETYNGVGLERCFAPQLKAFFSDKFPAILKMQLTHRYTYDKPIPTVRVSGKAIGMVAFPESNLGAMMLDDLCVNMVQPTTSRKRRASGGGDKEEVVEENGETVVNVKKSRREEEVYEVTEDSMYV